MFQELFSLHYIIFFIILFYIYIYTYVLFTLCIIPKVYLYLFQTFSRISTTVIHTYNETSTDKESSEVKVHDILYLIQYNKA